MQVKPYNVYVTVAYPPDTDTPGFAEENKTKVSTLVFNAGKLFSDFFFFFSHVSPQAIFISQKIEFLSIYVLAREASELSGTSIPNLGQCSHIFKSHEFF